MPTKIPDADESSVILVFVRHGQTQANKDRIIQGHQNIELCEHGRMQASRLSKYFHENNETFDLIYSSDLTRARETAELACSPLIDVSKIQLDVKLRERCLGTFEQKPVTQFNQEARKHGFKENKLMYFTPDGAESIEDIEKRVASFFDEKIFTKLSHGKRILVVTHGGIIRESIRYFRKLRSENLPEEALVTTPNTGVTCFRIRYLPDSGNHEDSEICGVTSYQIETIFTHQCPHFERKNENHNGQRSENGKEVLLQDKFGGF